MRQKVVRLVKKLRRRLANATSPWTFGAPSTGLNAILRARWKVHGEVADAFCSIYDYTIDRLLFANNMTWTENAFLPEHYPNVGQACAALRHLAVRHLLRECGDARATACVFEKLRDFAGVQETDDDKFYRELARYFAEESKVDAISSKNRMVLGLSAWGGTFIDRAVNRCLASLGAPDNLAVAKKHSAAVIVHTAQRDVVHLRNIQTGLCAAADIIVKSIPDTLVDAARGDNKYWLLGATQSLQLALARKHHARFGMLFPDVVYSNCYLRGISIPLDKGATATLLSAFGSAESILEPLKAFSRSGLVDIAATTLIDLAFVHLHQHFSEFFVDDDRTFPAAAGFFIGLEDGAVFHAAHYNLALIETGKILGECPRYYLSLDSELDKIVNDAEELYVRRRGDEYFATGIDDELRIRLDRLSLSDYCAQLSRKAGSVHMKLFALPYDIEVARSRLPPCSPQFSKAEARGLVTQILHLVAEERRNHENSFDRWDLVLDVLARYSNSSSSRARLALEPMTNIGHRLLANSLYRRPG